MHHRKDKEHTEVEVVSILMSNDNNTWYLCYEEFTKPYLNSHNVINKESYPAANPLKVTLRDSLSKEAKKLSLGSAMV